MDRWKVITPLKVPLSLLPTSVLNRDSKQRDTHAMNEIWKNIKGYEGRYQVSSLGRVKSLKRVVIKCNGVKQRTKGRTLKLKTLNNGYLEITLYTNQSPEFRLIHRLVMETFMYPSELHVNHIDGVKTNNMLDNLEYVTHLKNCNHHSLVLKKQTKYGVYLNKKLKKWITQISINNRAKYLGCFTDKEEAYQAFHDAYTERHGVSPW